jgi:hypothetical protein
MTFTFKLEQADGTPGRAADDREHRHELARRRDDPDRARSVAARGRHRRLERGRAVRPDRRGRVLKSVRDLTFRRFERGRVVRSARAFGSPPGRL